MKPAPLAGALAVVLLLFVGGVSAAENAKSANWVMPGCRAFIADKSVSTPFLAGVCAGAVSASQLYPGICPPEGVTTGQAVRVVVKFIDDQPARLHEDLAHLATRR